MYINTLSLSGKVQINQVVQKHIHSYTTLYITYTIELNHSNNLLYTPILKSNDKIQPVTTPYDSTTQQTR